MAKMSKYELMIGQVVSMSFAEVKVTGYRNPQVTSKTGRTYRKYEVEIDNVLWVSTTSFKNQSFSKRYFKALKEKLVNEPAMYYPAVKPMVEFKSENSEPVVEDDLEKFRDYIEKLFDEAFDQEDENEGACKRMYRKLSKQYHPDICKHPNASELFKIVKQEYSTIL